MRIYLSVSHRAAPRRVARSARTRNRIVLLGLALATVVGVSACSSFPGLTVEQIPLPAPGSMGKSISLHATFDNALNLPTRAKVKLNGTDVGQVTDITASNYKAKVTMKVSTSSRVAVGSGAELRQATPLGDVFVALLPPHDTASGQMLTDGGTLTGPTSAAATVEDLLISLSGFVDSGSLGSTQNIVTELSAAVSTSPDTPDELRGAVDGFTTGLAKLNQNKDALDESFRTTGVLTRQLADGRAQIMAAINKLAPALNVVSDNIGLITSTLDKTNKVTAATNDFLAHDSDDLVGMFHHLSELLSQLRSAAPTLGPLSDNLAALTPKWDRSTSGSGAAVATKLYWLSPGVGFDSASRLPELSDIDAGSQSLQQTLQRIIARLSGTQGCCG